MTIDEIDSVRVPLPVFVEQIAMRVASEVAKRVAAEAASVAATKAAQETADRVLIHHIDTCPVAQAIRLTKARLIGFLVGASVVGGGAGAAVVKLFTL